MLKALIFDLDNTLVECSKYYLDAQKDFGLASEQATGIPSDICINVLKAIDLESIKLPAGFSRVRFPRSFAATSFALDIMAEHEPDFDRAEAMWKLGDSVFTQPYPLYPGAWDALESLKDAGYRLALCTKGDDEVQRYKIKKNKLDSIFPEDQIWVTLKKEPSLLLHIADKIGLPTNEIAVIGDSLRDDISVGKEVGMRTIYVSGRANTSWAYEAHQNAEADHEVSTVADLSRLLVPVPGM